MILESTDQAIRFCANVNVIMKHGYYVEQEQMNTHTFLIASYYSHNYFFAINAFKHTVKGRLCVCFVQILNIGLPF